jgi:hypothetical protein
MVMVAMMVMAPSRGNAEHTLYAADYAANARAKRTTDRSTDRPRRTAAFIHALSRSTLGASDYALCIAYARDRQQSQRCRGKSKAPICRSENE